jgi:hypothetical protein
MGTSHAETGADPARASARTPRSGAEGGGKKKKRATARDGRNDESEQPKERARNDESGA